MGRKGKKTKSSPNLPIFKHKGQILEKIRSNSVVIITGQTGCGKSTQVPKYLLETGYGINGIIACLHPRCVAAMSLAERVSEELNDVIGGLVGYQVRFFKEESENTRIMFMTTGLMLQIMKDKACASRYSVIIIDEAHERSVQTDVMMGRMKEILAENKRIKLVVMSATLNVKQIQDYYENCAVVSIANAKDRIKIIYRPLKSENYIAEIKTTVEEILKTSTKGHILIFLQSEEKVFKCRKSLKKTKRTVLLPFYASLDYDEKMLVFGEYPGRRKIIIATNVAETSLTIAGVDFVIDSGFVKRVLYDHASRLEKWMTKTVSIAEADQRKGRTGRTGTGTCYRLYDEKCVSPIKPVDTLDFEMLNELLASLDIGDFPSNGPVQKPTGGKKTSKPASARFSEFPEPEIKTVNLSSIIMTLKAMGMVDIMRFPFIVAPDGGSVQTCTRELKDLSLLHDDGTLTKLGLMVSRLPLEPRLGKVATIGAQLPCRHDVFAIIAMLSVRNVLKSPSEAQNIHCSFSGGHGDLFVLRNLFYEALDNKFRKQWCVEHFVNQSCVKYAYRVFLQLDGIARVDLTGRTIEQQMGFRKINSENLVKKVFLSGFFPNIARKDDDDKYESFDGQLASVTKYSSLDRSEEIILFQTMQMPTESNLAVMRNCTGLNVQMVKNLVPQKFKIKAPLWKAIVDKQLRP